MRQRRLLWRWTGRTGLKCVWWVTSPRSPKIGGFARESPPKCLKNVDLGAQILVTNDWLARLVGNEGPSTFTLVYWGFIPSFPTKGQLDDGGLRLPNRHPGRKTRSIFGMDS